MCFVSEFYYYLHLYAPTLSASGPVGKAHLQGQTGDDVCGGIMLTDNQRDDYFNETGKIYVHEKI